MWKTKPGVVFAFQRHNFKAGVLLELLCETEITARSEEFKSIAGEIAMHIASSNQPGSRISGSTFRNWEGTPLLEQELCTRPINSKMKVRELLDAIQKNLDEEITIGKVSKFQI